jgi:hypothetical protein
MLIGSVSFGPHQNLILKDVDGLEVSLPLQDALALCRWIEERRTEIHVRITPQEISQREVLSLWHPDRPAEKEHDTGPLE